MSNEKLGAEQGREPQTFIEWWNSHAGPKNELAKGWAEAAWIAANRTSVNVDSLAAEIRRVDGKHSLGAGALAEALMPFLDHGTEQAYHARGAGRAAALEEVRRMLEDQRKECLNETVSMGLNRIRADELDNALINLRALAAEPGADTGTTPPPEECYVAWCRYKDNRIFLCDSDAPKAFKVYRWATLAERGTTPPEGPDGTLRYAVARIKATIEQQHVGEEPQFILNRVLAMLRLALAGVAATQRAPVEQVQPVVANIDLPRNEFEAAWAHYASTAPGTATEKNVFMAGWNAAAPDHAREGALLEAKWWYKEFVWPWRADDEDSDDRARKRLAALAEGKEALDK